MMSRSLQRRWIPAFAGMTAEEDAAVALAALDPRVRWDAEKDAAVALEALDPRVRGDYNLSPLTMRRFA